MGTFRNLPNTSPEVAQALYTSTTQMCQYTQATTHGCGHPRTIALVTKRCNDSQATGGHKCSNSRPPPPQVIADSKCWPCLQAQMGSQHFREFILGQLVVPETSELEALRGREDWMDVHRRERDVRMAAKGAERVE
jgi:hypothetical protein